MYLSEFDRGVPLRTKTTTIKASMGVQSFGWPRGSMMAVVSAIERVDLGGLDRTAPIALPQIAVATAVLDQWVELQWAPADDRPKGIGLGGDHYFRDGSYLGFRRNRELVDLTASPRTTYTYALQPKDFHRSQAELRNIAVATPDSLSGSMFTCPVENNRPSVLRAFKRAFAGALPHSLCDARQIKKPRREGVGPET
jgi:hypothetical protein